MTKQLHNPEMVVGVFARQEQAARAIRELRELGFTDEQMGVAASTWTERAAAELQTEATRGAVVGATAGAGIGAVAGALIASLTPGVGPVLAGGVLALTGAAGGTFVGPFLNLEASREKAEEWAQHVEEGATVLFVRTEDRQEEVQKVLLSHDAYDDSMRARPEE